jgi:hypothetical protein
MSDPYRPEPYVGISGVALSEQHAALRDVALRERIGTIGYFMMIGVQATGKTQVLDIDDRRGQLWYPVGDTIADAAIRDSSEATRPFVHCLFTDDELAQGVASVMRRTQHYVRGIQFNGLAWTDRDYGDVFRTFSVTYPGQSIILQAHRRVLESSSPRELANRLSGVQADYILLDRSGGEGIRMEPETLREYVDAIYQRQLPVGVAVAGGLDADTVEALFGPLAEQYPRLSCDAEGRLRKGPEGATELDLSRAEGFVLAWERAVSGSGHAQSLRSPECL